MSANITPGFELDSTIAAMCECGVVAHDGNTITVTVTPGVTAPAPQSPIVAEAIALAIKAGFPAGPALDGMAKAARDGIMATLVGLANAAMVQVEREIAGQAVRQREDQRREARHLAYCEGAVKPKPRLTRAQQTIRDAQRFGTCPAGVVA